MKILRPSVMTAKEWFKDRDQIAWTVTKQQVYARDEYSCVYCQLTRRKFMQVNHIGAEDDHRLDNLETICKACHSVLHLGINAMDGLLTVFECVPELENMAAIVAKTRALIAKNTPWAEIEQHILGQYLQPGGTHFTREESVGWASRILHDIKPPAFRGYLPLGYAVLFHEQGDWNGFPEKIHKWQCMPGSRYRKQSEEGERSPTR